MAPAAQSDVSSVLRAQRRTAALFVQLRNLPGFDLLSDDVQAKMTVEIFLELWRRADPARRDLYAQAIGGALLEQLRMLIRLEAKP